MSGEAKQPHTPAVRELFPAVVTALESRLLTAAAPPSSSAPAPHAPQDHHPPAPHHPHPAPQIYQPQHPPAPPRTDSPHGSMDDHRTTATAGSGSTTLQQQPLLASTSTPAGYALEHPTPHAHVQDPPAPPTPAKERVLSMSEKDVTDARMMPVPQTAYQPSRHPSVAYRDQGPYPSAPLSRAPTATRRASQVDWIVPTRQDDRTRDTVSRRLQPTIDVAKKRHFALSAKAKLFGRSLNAAIGLQIVVGALITGLAAVTTGRQTSIMTSVLGAFSTIIGSFLARMRGTSEPDLSKSRAKGYERFLRACEAFVVDSGDEPAREHIDRINAFRQEFEELEGSANAEQKGNNV